MGFSSMELAHAAALAPARLRPVDGPHASC